MTKSEEFKSKGLCSRCGKTAPLAGRPLCERCTEMRKRWRQNTSEEKKAQARQANRERYARLKEQGLCVQCAKPVEVQGEAICKSCKATRKGYNQVMTASERSMERYNFYKEKGICTSCGSEPVKEGKTLCWRCAANKNDALRLKYTGRIASEEEKEKRREEYNYYKEHGLCPRCHKEKPADGFVHCAACRALLKRKAQDKRNETTIERSMRSGFKVCYVCEKPVKEGYRLCEECYQRSLKSLEKAREASLALGDERPWVKAEKIRRAAVKANRH